MWIQLDDILINFDKVKCINLQKYLDVDSIEYWKLIISYDDLTYQSRKYKTYTDAIKDMSKLAKMIEARKLANTKKKSNIKEE